MPTFTIHYANGPHSPPIGDAPIVQADNLKKAIEFANETFRARAPSHQPSVGHVNGFWICNAQKKVVVLWREGKA